MIQPLTFDMPKRKLKPAPPPTPAQRRLQYRHAVTLCKGASTPAARAIADRLVTSWLGCDCAEE